MEKILSKLLFVHPLPLSHESQAAQSSPAIREALRRLVAQFWAQHVPLLPENLVGPTANHSFARAPSRLLEHQHGSAWPPTSKGPFPKIDLAEKISQWGSSLNEHDSIPVGKDLVGERGKAAKINWTEINVIGQWDKKFILAQYNGDLLVFDQHAVHERVRLELLLARLFNSRSGFGSGTAPIKLNRLELSTSRCFPATTAQVSLQEHELVSSARHQLEDLGWAFELSGRFVRILRVPTVLGVAVEASAGVLLQTAQEMRSLAITGDSIPLVPTGLKVIVASKACRGAIMFGRQLSTRECSNLIADLALCSNPFECAHGRPSVCLIWRSKDR